MITDSHAHLCSDSLYANLDAVLQRARENGIGRIINISTTVEELQKGLAISEKNNWIYNALATHPHDAHAGNEAMLEQVRAYAKNGRLTAIGETGLDYFYHHAPKEEQQEFLKRYLALALECSLPVVIHCREAFADLFRILDSHYTIAGKHAPGVLHCFTGNLQEAQEVSARGWYLSFSGIVTFKKSETLKEAAKIVPLDRLLIETDAPFLAPQSRRGKTNEPSYITETAACIAAIKDLPVQTIIEATSANAAKLFNL